MPKKFFLQVKCLWALRSCSPTSLSYFWHTYVTFFQPQCFLAGGAATMGGVPSSWELTFCCLVASSASLVRHISWSLSAFPCSRTATLICSWLTKRSLSWISLSRVPFSLLRDPTCCLTCWNSCTHWRNTDQNCIDFPFTTKIRPLDWIYRQITCIMNLPKTVTNTFCVESS